MLAAMHSDTITVVLEDLAVAGVAQASDLGTPIRGRCTGRARRSVISTMADSCRSLALLGLTTAGTSSATGFFFLGGRVAILVVDDGYGGACKRAPLREQSQRYRRTFASLNSSARGGAASRMPSQQILLQSG
jgi:hypothetical protein